MAKYAVHIPLLLSLFFCGLGYVHGDELLVERCFPSPEVYLNKNGFAIVRLDDWDSVAPPAKPVLPQRNLFYALPPNADISSVQLRLLDLKTGEITLNAPVQPGSPVGTRDGIDYGNAVNVHNGMDTAVYGSDDFYPLHPADLDSSGKMRKWNIVQVHMQPVQYNPLQNLLRYTTNIRFVIIYETKDSPQLDEARMQDTVMDQTALALVDNTDAATSWYGVTRSLEDVSSSNVYVVITTDAIYNHSTNLFGLVSHKEFIGYNVTVVTETGIDGNTGETGWNEVAGQSPDEKADRIRKWLQDRYISMGIQFVLLVGDPTPVTGSVPMKMCFPRLYETRYTSYSNSPTDHYYADLTGNWDLDGDELYGVYGTTNDGGSGGVDFLPEVYAGRLPVYDTNFVSLSNIIKKIICYEMSVDMAWRKTALLPESFSDTNGTDGAYLGECMRTNYLEDAGFTVYRMYQQGSTDPVYDSIFDSDEELLNEATPNYWAANQQGLVCWWAHGWSQGAAINGGGTLMRSSWCDELDDRDPSLVYMASCTCGKPEDSDNLGYAILKEGAIGAIAASRVSWYRVGTWRPSTFYADNAAIGYYTMERIATNNDPFGKALIDVKAMMGNGWSCDSWMNKMDFNLYGDPGIQLMTQYATDHDNDRLPDYWEVLHGLNTNNGADAWTDPDGDGFSNYQEWHNRTSPTNSDSMSGSYSSMSVAGSFNSWNAAANNMLRTDDFLWCFDTAFTNATNVSFKFAANGNWTANWGDNNQPAWEMPYWTMAESYGSNIVVSNTLNGLYTFVFDARTEWYKLKRRAENDTDNDAMPDTWEIAGRLNPYNPADGAADSDYDQLLNRDEYFIGTHPRRVDSDFDTFGDSIDSNPTVCAYAQTTVTAIASGYAASQNGTITHFSDALRWGPEGNQTNTGYLKFDVASLPETARIRVAALLYNATGTNVGTAALSDWIALDALDPVLSYQATGLYERICSGQTLQTPSLTSFPFITQTEEALYGNSALEHNIEKRLAANTWAVGLRLSTNGSAGAPVTLTNVTLVISFTDNGSFYSAYSNMSVAGTFSGWSPTQNNMTLIGHGRWLLQTNLHDSLGIGFKFTAGDWATNWGDDAQTDLTAPLSGTADWFGANITNENATTGTYVFVFDEDSLYYSLAPASQTDTDADGMSDAWEEEQGYDPYNSSDGITDTDGDNLSNQYEYENNGNPNVIDTDNDGVNDFDEVIAGTCLTNNASRLSPIGARQTNDPTQLTVTWHAFSDRIYDWMYLDADLAPNGWAGINGSTNMTGLSGTQELTFTNATDVNRRYYRLRVRRP